MNSDSPLEFAGRRLDEADFSNAQLHDANFDSVRITGGWLRNADIDGYIAGLKVNGVEVAPLVEAELDRRYPERALLRADDVPTLRRAWPIVRELWEGTTAKAKALPEARLHERVNGEWSFVETLRHLIFATDAWILHMVKRDPDPYHPWGVIYTSFAGGPRFGLDAEADPSVEAVLEIRRQRMDLVGEIIDRLTAEDLDRVCSPLNSQMYPER